MSNPLTTFHNKQRHSFKTKGGAASMNITTIGQRKQTLQAEKKTYKAV